MKKFTFLLLFIASAFTSFAQAPYADCHIVYKEIPHFKYFGRQVQMRATTASLDTLTCVYDGTFAYDMTKRHFVGYEGEKFEPLAFGQVRDTSISIASSAVLTLNSSPITIVPSPGSGYAIEVISAIFGITYNSIPYGTNYDLQIKTAGANAPQYSGEVLWMSLTGYKSLAFEPAYGPSQTQVIANAALQVTSATGDPAAGNSDIEVFVRYRIIEL